MLHSDVPGQGLVLAAVGAGGDIGVYSEGELIFGSTAIGAIRPDGLAIVDDGMWQKLQYPQDATRVSADSMATTNNRSDQIRLPGAGVPVTLQRAEVLSRLADLQAAAAALETAELRVDGYRLLRLTQVDSGSIYALLGLEPGDVLIAINEQPVHEGDNPLWQALELEPEVRLGVIRQGGRAHNLTFRIED